MRYRTKALTSAAATGAMLCVARYSRRSTGVDFSNAYLAELRKQGLTAAEANTKLYERDREMPDETVDRSRAVL